MGFGALLLAALAQTATATTSTQTGTTAADAPRIDLITIGVGDAMYAIFGHAAIRVIQPDGTDTAYNFGGVDMAQPNFWARLMQGRIEAYLEVTPYSELLLKYSAEDRSIVGRTLDFEPEVARKLVADLDRIASSDERTYLYHHIFDNCTTRVGDLFDKHLGGQLEAQAQFKVRGTHRDWILDRIRHEPWVYLAMDLAGNGMGDRPLIAWDTVFIPEGFDTVVDRAKFNGRPFVKLKYLEYRSLSYSDRPLWDWPWTKVYLLLLFPLLLLIAWRPLVGARVVGVIAGSIGLIYIAFWLISDYEFYHRNWNMIVFPPTHVLLVFVSSRKGVVQQYLAAHTGALAVLWVLSKNGLIHQAIGPMLAFMIPVALLLIVRLRAVSRTEGV